MAYNNTAYDFEYFQPKQKPVREEPAFQPKIVRKSNSVGRAQTDAEKLHRAKMLRIMVYATILTVLLGFTICMRANLATQVRNLDLYNSYIKEARNENIDLNTKLNEMMSLDTVEKKAVNELHMVKRDASQIHYVSVGTGDNYSDGERTNG